MFGKTSSSKSLPLSGIEAEVERLNDLEKFNLTIHSWNDKSKVPVARGSSSVSDLAGTNDVATNGVNGRIGNKTLWKCEYCAPMEISIEAVCCLEMPDICKPILSSTSCLNVCRSNPDFVLWYSRWENLVIWFPPMLIFGKSEQKFSFSSNFAIIVFCEIFYFIRGCLHMKFHPCLWWNVSYCLHVFAEMKFHPRMKKRKKDV